VNFLQMRLRLTLRRNREFSMILVDSARLGPWDAFAVHPSGGKHRFMREKLPTRRPDLGSVRCVGVEVFNRGLAGLFQ
jgi:hypothetical protein